MLVLRFQGSCFRGSRQGWGRILRISGMKNPVDSWPYLWYEWELTSGVSCFTINYITEEKAWCRLGQDGKRWNREWLNRKRAT